MDTELVSNDSSHKCAWGFDKHEKANVRICIVNGASLDQACQSQCIQARWLIITNELFATLKLVTEGQ